MVHILGAELEPGPTGGTGGPKKGDFMKNIKIWLPRCLNISKFDEEHDGTHPRGRTGTRVRTQGKDT